MRLRLATQFVATYTQLLYPYPPPTPPLPLSVATVWHAIVALRPLKVIVLLANMHQMGNISTLHGFLFLGAQPCCNWPHHQRQQQHHQLEGASTNRVGSQLGSSSTWHIDYVATSPPDTRPPPLHGNVSAAAPADRQHFGAMEERRSPKSQVEEPTAKLLFLSFYPLLVCLLSLREQRNPDYTNV